MKEDNEDMLIRQSRFILMGEMMANISHQWKQPLNTINLAVLSARTSDYSQESLERYFEIIESNVNHLAATIDDFTLFMDKKTCIEPRDLNAIIKEVNSIIGIHMQKQGIDLNIELKDGSEKIMIASSISQVLLNLLNNSKDAFLNENIQKNINIEFKIYKDYLRINCCDNGKGIKKELLNKIFDPYFTTKETGKGTGIGLYMSEQIIKKIFHGKIEVSSEPGKTCFYLSIPYSKNCIMKEDD